jgi:pimeloyl-ACP methyl ester carboxylesterase
MKILFKILKFSAAAILLLLLVFSIYIYASGPTLPKETDKVIDSVENEPLPLIVTGKTGFARSQGLNIWYESISPKQEPKGAVLLMMGISSDALAWPKKFINAFVDSGYQVIIYDNRGTGESDWVKNWDSRHPYTLADMADDGVAVLHAAGLKKAHIIGVSMGGMMAQELAIRHPECVISLASVMSSGYIEDPALQPISSGVAFNLIKAALKYEVPGGDKNMIRLQVASRVILRGQATYPLNVKEIAGQVLYDVKKRKGYNPNVSKQQAAAVMASGSRYEALKKLRIPVLVIHGKQDPFIPIAHGRKCAITIPQADTFWVDNMGHDLPDNLADTLTQRIIANFHRVFIEK